MASDKMNLSDLDNISRVELIIKALQVYSLDDAIRKKESGGHLCEAT